MAITLARDINWAAFGTGFAPGVNNRVVRRLFDGIQIVPEQKSSVLSESELASAIEMLRAIIPDEELELLAPTGPATVYTTSLTIWMLILQRLGKGKTNNEVVKDVLSSSRQLLPDNIRVR